MPSSSKKQKFLTRVVTSLIMAAVIIPAYFIADGRYLGWVLRFGFLMALIEYISVICGSSFIPFHVSEHAVTCLVLVELFVCLDKILEFKVELLGGLVFVCVLTDMFAYLFGNLFGGTLIKRRPFPKISPNKSFEGLIFGVSLGIIAAFVWTLLMQAADTPVPFWRLFFVAPISVVGDLLESRFKRLYDVKDANDFLLEHPVFELLEKPLGGRDGHGGYLDRLDSLALAITFVITLQFFIP